MKGKYYDRNFVLMVIGQVISILGSAVLRFALDLYVLDITGRADIFATVMAISMIPIVIFSPVGGAIADRFSRRDLMVIFDFTSSATVLALIILFWTGGVSVAQIAVIITLLSVISAMYQPAVQASIPSLVDPQGLAQANGVVNGVGAVSGLIGPVLGGVLYGVIGIENLIVISCAAFFLSAVMEIFIRIPFIKQPQTRHIVATIAQDMKDGFLYIARKNRRIFNTILLAAALNLFLSSFLIIGAPYVLRVTMNSSETMYGVGMGLTQLASIAGALMAGLFASRLKLETLYKWLLGIAALLLPMALAMTKGVLALGYWPPFILFFLFAVLIMMMATLISIFVITEVQKQTPNEYLGKVMAIIMAVAQCATPLGQLIYGVAFERFNDLVFVPVLIASVFTALVGLVAKAMLKPDASAQPLASIAD